MDLIDKELVVISTAGSVDDGKSTLIGRLLYDCNDIYEDHMKTLRKDKDGNVLGEDLALLTDGLSAEREQGITIDVAYRHFSRSKRKFIIADVPGHEQYTRNMITGMSKANIAIILADARKGILKQSKRHLFIASLLGISHILVVVNKMDLVGYKRGVFEKIKADFSDFALKMNISDLRFIPVSSKIGDMVVNRGSNMDWYEGTTLLSYLENVQIASDRNLIDFRLPVQNVIRPNQDFRGYAGKVCSGIIKKGEKILVLPSTKQTTVKEIYVSGKKCDIAYAPQGVVLETDDELDISRGDVIAREDNLPVVSKGFESMICWFDKEPLDLKKTYIIKQTTKTTRAKISKIKYKLDIEELHRKKSESLKINEFGRVSIETNSPLIYDVYHKNKETGSFIIIDELSNFTVGAGIIVSKGKTRKTEAEVQPTGVREGAVLWFTGLSGAGKSTLADLLYKRLKDINIKSERLDGDIVRNHLTKDLGFSKEDRDKNIERVAYVASLLSKHGVLVLASFISPYEKQRKMARDMAGNFVEIFVNAPLKVCEKRDVKGMYKKARKGEIKNFTGVSDPYECPKNPELEIKTDEMSLEKSVDLIVEYLKEKNYLK